MTGSGTTSRLTTRPVFSGYPAVETEGKSADSAKFVSTLLAFYIFLLAGRVLDVSPLFWWMRIPLITLSALILITIARGGLQFAFSSKIVKYFAAFTIWVLICYPFSKWRAGSFTSVYWQVQSFVIFVIIVQTVRTRRAWQKVVGGFAYATLVASLLSFHFNYTVEGRIALPGGTLGDPNEFALLLVVGLPFWWFKAKRATGFRKIFFLCCTIPVFLTFARTGSRSGMLAMAVLFLVSFIFARGTQKLAIPLVALIGIMASSFVLPGYIRTRFTTFFSAQGNYDSYTQARIGSDIASSEERKALLMQSIHMTFEHPIVGVGPGCFSFVAWDERKAATGSGGENLVSHNTYTQISSETGIPGFLLFAITIFLCVRTVIADYRRLVFVDAELAQYARYLFTAIAAMTVGIFFLSVGYTHMSATIFALVVSLHYIVENSLKKHEASVTPRVSDWPGKNRLGQPLQRPMREVARVTPQQPAVPGLRGNYGGTSPLRQRKRTWPENS
jgi:O-antigen ligase